MRIGRRELRESAILLVTLRDAVTVDGTESRETQCNCAQVIFVIAVRVAGKRERITFAVVETEDDSRVRWFLRDDGAELFGCCRVPSGDLGWCPEARS